MRPVPGLHRLAPLSGLLSATPPGVIFVAGCWMVQQLPALPGPGVSALLLGCGFVLVLVGRNVLLLGTAALAVGWAMLLAHQGLERRLPAAQNGQDVTVLGRIESMPQAFERGVRFRLLIDRCISTQAACPGLVSVMVNWYRGFGRKRNDDEKAIASVRAGQRWQLSLRLKQARAAVNPGLFDAELRSLQEGISALAYVRKPSADFPNVMLEASGGGLGARIERLRDLIRERMHAALKGRDPAAAGVVVALVIGDQAAIGPRWWELFNRTGIGHLMSISGLHITMLAGMAAWVAGRTWRSAWLAAAMPTRPLAAILPTPYARWVFGLVAAFGYSALAGWGIPAQRTCWMLAVAGFAMTIGRGRSTPAIIGTAGGVVCLMDPWAPMSAGFWLSFAAVGAIIWAGAGVRRPQPAPTATDLDGNPEGDPQNDLTSDLQGDLQGNSDGNPDGHADASTTESTSPTPLHRRSRMLAARVRPMLAEALRTQYAATIVLLPLGVLFFANVSVVSPIANAVAIPVVSAVITPLAMFSTAMLGIHSGAGGALLSLACWITEGLLALLEWMDAGGMGAIAVPLPDTPVLLLAALGCVLLLAPIPLPGRALAGFALLPMLFGQADAPAAGELRVTALDIGQGTAVLVEAGGRRLLYDAGPRFGADSDAGARTIVPYLRARGIRHLDAMVVSHLDLDHSGGALAVLRNLKVDWVASSLPNGHPITERAVRHFRCLREEHWRWGDTHFRWLHPGRDELDSAHVSTNGKSCVLRIESPAGVVLLAGDIEARQEKRLLARFPASELRAHLLLAPHHGSRTSSTERFLAAVSPRIAIFQLGFRNRYRHPNPIVLQRYRKHDVQILRSDEHGAITVSLRPGKPPAVFASRLDDRRYWRIRDERTSSIDTGEVG